MNSVLVQPLSRTTSMEKGWLEIYFELFKVRLTFLVVVTTLVGFYIGFRRHMDYALMLHTVLGTALVAGGASALNQLMESDYDALMHRTQQRPLPSCQLRPKAVLLIGCAAACLGLTYLLLAVNAVTSLLGAFSLFSYL